MASSATHIFVSFQSLVQAPLQSPLHSPCEVVCVFIHCGGICEGSPFYPQSNGMYRRAALAIVGVVESCHDHARYGVDGAPFSTSKRIAFTSKLLVRWWGGFSWSASIPGIPTSDENPTSSIVSTAPRRLPPRQRACLSRTLHYRWPRRAPDVLSATGPIVWRQIT